MGWKEWEVDDAGLTTDTCDSGGSADLMAFVERGIDAIEQRLLGVHRGDRGEGNEKQDEFAEFGFHGMRMGSCLFVCWIGGIASLLLVYPSALQLCVSCKKKF